MTKHEVIDTETQDQDARAVALQAMFAELMTSYSKEGESVVVNLENVCVVLRHHPDVRDCFGFNLFGNENFLMMPIPGSKEAKKPDAFEPRLMVDTDYPNVQRWFQRNVADFAKVAKEVIRDGVDIVCRERSFDPLKQWAERCAEEHDGKERVQYLFRDYFVAKEQNLYSMELGEVMMMNLVLRALEPGSHTRMVPVLRGKQNIGKSTALEALCPRPGWFADHLPPLSSKDAQKAAASNFIIELAEMDISRKAEREELKAFITRRIEKFRAPYGRLEEAIPRRCMLVGTTNDDTYLRDATGSTRFFPIEIESVDIAAIRRDRDQLIGEAVKRLRNWDDEDGEWPWWRMSDEATEILDGLREEAEVEEPWLPIVAKFVDGLAEVCAGMVLGDQVPVTLLNGENGSRRGLRIEPSKQTSFDARKVNSLLKNKLGWRQDGLMPHGSPWARTARLVPPKKRKKTP